MAKKEEPCRWVNLLVAKPFYRLMVAKIKRVRE